MFGHCSHSLNYISETLERFGVEFDPRPFACLRSENEEDLFSYLVPPVHINGLKEKQQAVYIVCKGGGKTALCQWMAYKALWQPDLTTIVVPVKIRELAARFPLCSDYLSFCLQVSVCLFAAHYSKWSSLSFLFPANTSAESSAYPPIFALAKNKEAFYKWSEQLFGTSVAKWVAKNKVEELLGFLSDLAPLSCPGGFWDTAKNVMGVLGCNLIVVFDDNLNYHDDSVAKMLAENWDMFAEQQVSTVALFSPRLFGLWDSFCKQTGAGKHTQITEIAWSKDLLREVLNERITVATNGRVTSFSALPISEDPATIEDEILSRSDSPRKCIVAAVQAMAHTASCNSPRQL